MLHRSIALKEEDQAFVGLPDALTIESEQTLNVDLAKGLVSGNLLLLMPQNKFTTSDLVNDAQSQILKPVFKREAIRLVYGFCL